MRGSGVGGGLGRPFRPAGRWPPVPRIWPGETAVIAASGPSLTKEQLGCVRGKARLIVVNNSWELAPWADLLYACDGKWWRVYKPGFSGLKVSQDASVEGVLHIPSVDEPGLSLDPLHINQGANSGYQALNLAVLLGAQRVILLGFDMHGTHWHGAHGVGLNNPDAGNFARWVAAFETTLADLKRAGVDVINCTPDSALKCFPMANLETVL